MQLYGLFFLKEGKPHIPVCEHSSDNKKSLIVAFLSEDIAQDYLQKNIHAYYRDILLIKKIEQPDLEKSIASEKTMAKKAGLKEDAQVYLNIRDDYWHAPKKTGE